MAVAATISCTGEEFAGNDPPGYSCEYSPGGETGRDFLRPTAEQLGKFDAFVRVRVTGHEETGPSEAVVNLAEATEVLDGGIAEGADIEVRSNHGVCLETGEDYYLLLTERAGGDFYEIDGPWSHFPVINNRITLHVEMRLDELIGSFHGLDPVLFKRRFTEFTGRTDIEVG